MERKGAGGRERRECGGAGGAFRQGKIRYRGDAR
mgnify:CR=1 FL=1